MWLQMNKINYGFILLITAALSSLNVMAKDAEVSKDTAAKTESRVVDAWQVTCSIAKDGKQSACVAILKITQQTTVKSEKDKPQENVVMLWQIAKGQNGSLVSTIQTPTGVVIKPGLQLKLASAQAVTLPYVSCDRQACFAGLEMDDHLLKQAVAAQKIDIALQAIDGRVYTYSFSPKGIDKAIQAVK